MIHLSVQDIALLANLAGCCSSIDEFREYAVRTFGTDTSILSGQDEPAEFIVSYGSIDKIDLSPTQRQMMSAFNTINKLNKPGKLTSTVLKEKDEDVKMQKRS